MHIDLMYAKRIENYVRNFKQKDRALFSFSCPICGDSKKNKLKARGYLYEKSNKLFYRCHNCQISLSLKNFLKEIDKNLFKDYNRDKFADKNVPVRKKSVMKKKKELFKMTSPSFSPLNQLQTIKELPEDHIAKVYVKGRGIPEIHYDYIYFVDEFQKWTNTIIPDKFAENTMHYDCPRIVLPFFNANKKLIGFQGRAIDASESIRYYTIKIEDEPMIFGMERVDPDKTIYVLEGPIDSLFLPNAIAGACASLPKFNNCVLIYDNEKRNKEICKQMKKSIKEGHSIFIWPSTIHEKDINELHNSVGSYIWSSYIKQSLQENTYSGLMATAKLSEWRK